MEASVSDRADLLSPGLLSTAQPHGPRPDALDRQYLAGPRVRGQPGPDCLLGIRVDDEQGIVTVALTGRPAEEDEPLSCEDRHAGCYRLCWGWVEALSAGASLKLPRRLDCILDGTSVALGEISHDHHVLAVPGRDAEGLGELPQQPAR